MDQKLNQAVSDAAKEMFGSMLGWSVSCASPVARPLNGNGGTPGAEASAVISFVGNPSGAFALKCSRAFAAQIASQMLGMDVDEQSSDMTDAIGEFLNMIVGRAKALYATGDPFKMSVPTLVIGGDYSLHIKASGAKTVSAIDVQYEGHTLSIEVVLN